MSAPYVTSCPENGNFLLQMKDCSWTCVQGDLWELWASGISFVISNQTGCAYFDNDCWL